MQYEQTKNKISKINNNIIIINNQSKYIESTTSLGYLIKKNFIGLSVKFYSDWLKTGYYMDIIGSVN